MRSNILLSIFTWFYLNTVFLLEKTVLNVLFMHQTCPKRSEQRSGIGVEKDEPGKRGYWGLPRDQTDRGKLIVAFGRVQGNCDAGTEPKLGWRCNIISGIPRLLSRGDMPVWSKRHCKPAGDGGEALVHLGMLSGAWRQDDHQRRGGGDGRETEGDGVDCCRGPERGTREDWYQGKGQGDHDDDGDGRLGGYGGTSFLPEETGVVSILENVVNEVEDKGS